MAPTVAMRSIPVLCARSMSVPISVSALRPALLAPVVLSRAPTLGPLSIRHLSTPTPSSSPATEPTYTGPLATSFARLKVFSLSSIGLAFALSPFIYLLPAALPTSARSFLIVSAIGLSGISTSMIGWCGRPYVSTLNLIPPPKAQAGRQPVELENMTLFMRKLRTHVADTRWFRPTSRPLAVWEIRDDMLRVGEGEGGRTAGEEEVVAETWEIKTGKSVGRWTVVWEKDPEMQGGLKGEVKKEGKVERYFNVHEVMVPEITIS